MTHDKRNLYWFQKYSFPTKQGKIKVLCFLNRKKTQHS